MIQAQHPCHRRKAVKDWLNGSNADNNGIAINHRRIHPDYMGGHCPSAQWRGTVCHGGETVPEETVFNADLIYQAMGTWNLTPKNYNAPGGSMYKRALPQDLLSP